MIESLRGTCLAVRSTSIVLDVNGVGYGVEMPLTAICEVSPGQKDLQLWIHSHVREDAIRYFGFLTFEERSAFDVLLSLNGIGPKAALAILSTLSVAELRDAVVAGRQAAFQHVPGIGPRLAERIVVELRPKVHKITGYQATGAVGENALVLERQVVSRAGGVSEPLYQDVKSALENLGFKTKDIDPILERLARSDKQATLSDLMRTALLELTPPSQRGRPLELGL